MSKKYFFILLLQFFIFSNSSTEDFTSNDRIDQYAQKSLKYEDAERAALVGTWYRSQLANNGKISKNLAKVNSDGTYLFHFYSISKSGKIFQYKEKGLWGYSSGYQFTIRQSRSKGGSSFVAIPSKSWLYRILNISSNSIRLQTTSTKNIFTYKRVAENFNLLQ